MKLARTFLLALCILPSVVNAQSDYTYWFEKSGVNVSYQWSCNSCDDRRLWLKFENTNSYEITWAHDGVVWKINGQQVGGEIGASWRLKAYATSQGGYSGLVFYPPQQHKNDPGLTMSFKNFRIESGLESVSMSSTTQSSALADQQREQQKQQQEQQAKQLEEQRKVERQSQLDRLNAANEKTGEAWQNAFTTLGDVFDVIIQNSFRNSIERENQKRYAAFTKLNELVDTKNGKLSDCNYCSGHGYNSCSSCSASGKITCTGCFGKGTSLCTLCYGTGKFAGATCGSCGGKGNFECTICKGSGKSYCTSCSATGKAFCYNCNGTGQKFEEDLNARLAPAQESYSKAETYSPTTVAAQPVKKSTGMYPDLTSVWDLVGTGTDIFYDECVKCTAVTADDYRIKGWCYATGLKDHQAALLEYNKGLKIDPEHRFLYSYRSSAYSQLGRHEEALADANKELQLSGGEQSYDYTSRMEVRYYAGDYRGSIEDADKALSMKGPEYMYYIFYIWKGKALAKLGDRKNAKRNFSKAQELEPGADKEVLEAKKEVGLD
ncbi:MAG: hypothetical protein WDO15_12360 [Bacteroidota bacterium]